MCQNFQTIFYLPVNRFLALKNELQMYDHRSAGSAILCILTSSRERLYGILNIKQSAVIRTVVAAPALFPLQVELAPARDQSAQNLGERNKFLKLALRNHGSCSLYAEKDKSGMETSSIIPRCSSL